MVVAFSTSETSQQTSTHKKNRRKLQRKNGAKPGSSSTVTVIDPSSSTTDGDDNDNEQEMHDITQTADLPEGFSSSLFPVPQSSTANDDDDELMIDADPSAPTDAPLFPPASASAQRTTLRSESRRIPIPPHRMTPLKKDWVNIFGPLTEILGLQVRMNVQRRCIEIRVRHSFMFFRLCS